MALHLYHVTVQVPGAIIASERCFFGSNEEHLVLARGQWLEVLRIVDDEPVLRSRTNVFASIRCIQRVPAQGGAPDVLALTSDSGDFVLLNYDCKSDRFSQLASESIGRSGFRRTTPGEYLAVDPKGRVALVASIEKLRLAYVLHSDGISSAVEAPAPSIFCYCLVAMDRGYGNPAFASLERFRFGPKTIVMYEFNLGLNHLFKVWSHDVSENTDVITAIPGGRDGPSGVIVFSGSVAAYLDPTTGNTQHEIVLPNPVICARTVGMRRGNFFVLVQSVIGECFTLRLNDDGLSYASIASAPRAVDFQVLRSGHLFVNSEVGDQQLIQITDLEPFQLGETSTMSSISPCISSILQRKQLVVLNHSDTSSRVSLLEYGRAVEELISTPLPGAPSAVHATKRSFADAGHRLIALSFENSTTFLHVGDDGSVNEASEADTGLNTKVHTLGLHFIGNDALVQVHSSGFRYVGAQTVPWIAPKGSKVTGCAFTPTQMLLTLDKKQALYFEARDNTLAESKERVELPSIPTAICFESLLSSELTSTAFYIACEDESIRLFNAPALKQQKVFNAPSPIASMQHRGTLHLGHMNGTYSALRETHFWTKVLGSDPVKLAVLEDDTVLALTSRNWIINGTDAMPLAISAPNFVAVHPFVTEDLPNGVLGVHGSALVVFTVPSINNGEKTLKHDLVAFRSSMSRITRNFQSSFWYVSGAECISVVENSLDKSSPTNPFSLSTGMPSVACTNVRFDSHKMEALVVATKTKIQTYEYRGSPLGSELRLMHETQVGHCSAILPYKGMLLAAVNKTRLVLYDLGQKQLLRQGGIDLPDLSLIKVLRASRDRIYVGDSRHSVTVLSNDSQHFHVLYRDPIPRSVTAMVILDYATVCIGDQYGNIAVLRCSSEASGLEVASNSGEELQLVAHFRIPDGIIDLHRGVLTPVAGVEAIIYVGIQGTIGAFIPLTTKEDRAFMTEVESEVSRRTTNLTGRDSLVFRGYYSPPKSVVDGDLCEFALSTSQGLDRSAIEEIAEALDSEPSELIRRVLMFRERSVF